LATSAASRGAGLSALMEMTSDLLSGVAVTMLLKSPGLREEPRSFLTREATSSTVTNPAAVCVRRTGSWYCRKLEPKRAASSEPCWRTIFAVAL
jgi:hypothetical protein